LENTYSEINLQINHTVCKHASLARRVLRVCGSNINFDLIHGSVVSQAVRPENGENGAMWGEGMEEIAGEVRPPYKRNGQEQTRMVLKPSFTFTVVKGTIS